MTYFLITSGEDGIAIGEYTADELMKAMSPDKYGDVEVSGPFLKKIPDIDKGCFMDDGVLIIKGEVIAPTAVETVTKYKLT